MWNFFKIELYVNEEVVNANLLTPDFFERPDDLANKDELEGIYHYLCSEILRKGSATLNSENWNTLKVSLIREGSTISELSIDRLDFDSQVSSSSIGEAIFNLYTNITV
jgi:hypothetical protein